MRHVFLGGQAVPLPVRAQTIPPVHLVKAEAYANLDANKLGGFQRRLHLFRRRPRERVTNINRETRQRVEPSSQVFECGVVWKQQ